MERRFKLLIKGLKSNVLSVTASLEQHWGVMKLNAEEIAQRRRSRTERGEQNFLWCWKHRGFW